MIRRPEDTPATYLARHRRRLRRERAVRLWAGRCAYTLGYVLMTAAAIALLWLYGP